MITSSPAMGEIIFKGGTPMASNYTEQYKLCQWEETDAVLRTDFNEDNAKIEAALATLAEDKVSYDIMLVISSEVGNLRNRVANIEERLDALES